MPNAKKRKVLLPTFENEKEAKQYLISQNAENQPVSQNLICSIVESLGLSEEESVDFYGWCESQEFVMEDKKEALKRSPASKPIQHKKRAHVDKYIKKNTLDPLQLYFNDIGQYRLLTAKEEVELANRIQGAQSRNEEDKEAMETLVCANLRLVINIAADYKIMGKKYGVSYMDMIQDGNLGLWRAATKYKPDYRFSTYATYWIRQTILRGISTHRTALRVPIHIFEDIQAMKKIETTYVEKNDKEIPIEELVAKMNEREERKSKKSKTVYNVDKIRYLKDLDSKVISMEKPVKGNDGNDESVFQDFLSTPKSNEAEEKVSKMVLHDEINKALNRIPKIEREIIILRFGIGQPEALKVSDVAKKLGLTVNKVKSLQEDAIMHLGMSFQDNALMVQLFEEIQNR